MNAYSVIGINLVGRKIKNMAALNTWADAYGGAFHAAQLNTH